MESIAVTKPDMRIERQETLSPFGFLNQVFAEELIRRNSRDVGYYRPMRLAYLEEEAPEAEQNPPEIRFDLDVDLIVNRLLKAEKGKDEKEKKEKEKKTPAQRILERVILREKEIRIAYPETRRLVIESAGRRVTAEVPLGKPERMVSTARIGKTASEAGRQVRQDGEGRSTGKTELLRPSAALARPVPGHAAASAAGQPVRERKLPLASQAMSVPAAGGWKPTEREAHPGYPGASAKAEAQAIPTGSILLPDVMRRRREEALERRERAETPADGSSQAAEGLSWLLEDTQETPETERVFRELRRAVSDTLRRNLEREHGGRTRGETAGVREMPGQSAVPPRQRESDRESPAEARTAPTERTDTEAARRAEAAAQASQAAYPAEPTYREKETDARKHPGGPISARVIGPAEESSSGTAVPGGEQAFAAGEAKLREAGSTEPVLPAAMAAAAPGPEGPAELVYREDEERNEPAAAGGESSRPSPERATPVSPAAGERPGREEKITPAAAERGAAPPPADTPRMPVSHEDNAAPAAAARESGDDLHQAATALPQGGEVQAAQGAELVYRESGESAAPETAAPAGREGTITPAATERGAASAAAETPRTPASYEDNAAPGHRTPKHGETLREAAREALSTALPQGEEARTAQGAELIYRENGESAAPETVAPAGREEKTAQAVTETVSAPAAAETPRTPVSHEDNAAPGHRTPKHGEALREEAAREALPTALPPEGEAHTAQGAALVYRENGGSAAPETAAPAGREEKTAHIAAETVSSRAAAETPRTPVSHEDNAAPGPKTAERREMRSEAAAAVLPTAFPEEKTAQTAQGAELVYRAENEAAASASAVPAIQKSGTGQTALLPSERGPERAAAGAIPAAPETPSPREAGKTRESAQAEQAEAPAREAETQAAALKTAIPSDTAAAPPSEAAALVYREERETDPAAPAPQSPMGEHARPASGTRAGAPETENSSGPAAIGRKQAAAPGEAVLREPEGQELRRPAALPLEEAQEAAYAEMVHLEGRTREMPGGPAHADTSEQSPRTAGRELEAAGRAESRGASAPGRDGTRERTSAGSSEEAVTAEAAPATAVPAQEAAQAAGPSELRYLTDRENAAEATDFRPSAEQGRAVQKTAGTPASAPESPGAQAAGGKALPRGEKETAAAEAGTPYAREEGSPETIPAAALPAEPVTEETDPASLIYRDSRERPAPRPEGQTQAAGTGRPAGRQASVRQSEAAPSGGAADRAAGRSAAPGREHEGERGAPVPEAPAAIPAEMETQRMEQAALVYREAAPEDAGLFREERAPVPPAAQRADTPRPPESSVRETNREELAAALPGPQTEASTLQPIGLQLRAAETTRQPVVMGSAVRDIRMAAERRPAPRTAANQAQRTESVRSMAAGTAAGLSFLRKETSPATAAPAPETAAPEPTALVFAPLTQSGETGQQEAPARPTQRAENSKSGSLPQWAQELLEKAGVTDTAQQAAAFGGNGTAAGRQISWTAPAAMPAQQSRPAAQPVEMTFKEKGGAEETVSQPQISDAEIQRTADRVYRIIEERLRRELRRSGR